MNIAKNQKIKLAETIEYQAGSVVSKEIVKGKTSNVTVFAFAKGEGLKEHSAPFDAMVTIIDGSAEIYISGKKHELATGEMIIMPANEPHAVKAVEQFKMMLVMIRG